LGKLDLTMEPSGHVSARVPGEERALIKARGPAETGLRFVTARDIITVDFSGKKVAGDDGLESPQEVFIHTWLYKTRPDVQCVVHVHPLTVVLFTICNKPLLPLFGAYDPSGLRLLVHGLAHYPRSITEEATLTAIKLNEAALINYRAALLGAPQPIAQEDIDVIVGKSMGRNTSVYGSTNWRYYCKLVGEE
jgi:L-fuculose-phosphate aldolase